MRAHARRGLVLFLALSFALNPVAAFAVDCNVFLFARRGDKPLESLVQGEKIYGEIPDDFEIDEQTSRDVNLEGVAKILDPYLNTDLARARWRYRLHHPLLNPEEIRRQQEIVKFIADNPEKFTDLRDSLKKLEADNDSFVDYFLNMNTEAESPLSEKAQAGLTWLLMVAAPASKLVFNLAVYLAPLLAGQAAAFGYMNAIRNVIPKRKAMTQFRDHFSAARQSVTSLTSIENDSLKDLSANLDAVYQGEPRKKWKQKIVRFNSLLNIDDRDLVKRRASAAGAAPDEGLLELHQHLRLLEKSWKIKVPALKKPVRLPDYTTMLDKLFISNFTLRDINNLIVDKRLEIARVLSGLAELEVLLGLAAIYNQHRDKLIFPEILDLEQPTQMVIRGAHHPVIATDKPGESVPNDLVFGYAPGEPEANAFSVSFSPPGGGTTTVQQSAVIQQLLAQNGAPIFAQSARLTPGIVMTSLDLRASLNGKTSFTQVEARRISMILRMSDLHPHSFAYINNPFTEGGEFTGISLREATLHRLIESRTVGIMSSRSRVLLKEIQNMNGIRLVQVQNFRVMPFVPEVHGQELRPAYYYSKLETDGMPDDVTEMAAQIYKRLSEEYLHKVGPLSPEE